jgi:hypothetical protein
MWEPGTLVKIRRNGERFWIKPVIHVKENTFRGKSLNNCINQTIKIGDTVEFTSQDVVDTMKEDTHEKSPVPNNDSGSDLLP